MGDVPRIGDLLDGHAALDVECLDRIYLNGYVPNLQVAGQVASFMTAHLKLPIPSPAIMEKMGTRFRNAVRTFATTHQIPVVKFDKGSTWFSFAKADRRVTCFYFYLWDEDFGPGFIKVCTYFPYPLKVWLNGHEWAKRQATVAGIGFTELSNGFATCEDPSGLQDICDRLGPGTIEVFSSFG